MSAQEFYQGALWVRSPLWAWTVKERSFVELGYCTQGAWLTVSIYQRRRRNAVIAGTSRALNRKALQPAKHLVKNGFSVMKGEVQCHTP